MCREIPQQNRAKGLLLCVLCGSFRCEVRETALEDYNLSSKCA